MVTSTARRNVTSDSSHAWSRPHVEGDARSGKAAMGAVGNARLRKNHAQKRLRQTPERMVGKSENTMTSACPRRAYQNRRRASRSAKLGRLMVT